MFIQQEHNVIFEIITLGYTRNLSYILNYRKIEHKFLEEKVVQICNNFLNDDEILNEYNGEGIKGIYPYQMGGGISYWIREIKPIILTKADKEEELAKYVNEYLALAVIK
ncbi:MAG: hypothetical protein V1770_00145 [bacterium]